MKKYIISFILYSIFIPCVFSQTGGNAVIYPEDKYGEVMEYLIFDLKLSMGDIWNSSRAQTFFNEYDMNGIRVSVYGTDAHPFHPEKGTVLYDELEQTGYYKMIRSIKYAMEARGNKDFMVFASKKLNGKSSFPEWTKDENDNVDAEAYTDMLLDYFNLMDAHDIPVDAIGVDNEFKFNEGTITPERYKDIRDLLKTKLTNAGYPLPLFVGYEDFDPNLNNWVSTLMNYDWGDRMDIYGVHYYPNTRKLSALKADLGLIEERPFWSTEAHWSSVSGQDELAAAEIGMTALWDQTDQGLNALCMWDFRKGDTDLRFNLLKEAMIPLKDAQPVFMNDIDGINTSTYGKLQTRAFIEDDIVTVYAINMGDASLDNYVFDLNYGQILSSVNYVQFRDETGVKGESGTATTQSGSKGFELSLPSRSITKFSFILSPLNITKLECEDLSYSSPTGTSILLQTNSNAANNQHLNFSSDGEGQIIEFEFNTNQAGYYNLMLTGLTWNTFGQFDCQIQNTDDDWVDLTGTIDFYKSSSTRNSLTWENVELKLGANKIRFISSGKDEASTGFKGSFDYLVVEKTAYTQVSVNTKPATSNVLLYPNPVSSELNIKGLEDGMKYKIINTVGAVMLEGSSANPDLTMLDAGFYILKIEGKGYSFYKN